MAPLRMGLVGLGTISPFYLSALSHIPSINLAAVCAVDPVSLTSFADHVDCYTDHQAMLEATDIDAVVVTTPNDVHFAVCRDALGAGVDVCVEKPLATRLADAQALVGETLDGYLVVGIDGDDALRRLCQACRVDVPGTAAGEVETGAVRQMATRPARELAGAVEAAGLPCAVVCTDLAALPEDPNLAGLFEPVSTGCRIPASPWRFVP